MILNILFIIILIMAIYYYKDELKTMIKGNVRRYCLTINGKKTCIFYGYGTLKHSPSTLTYTELFSKETKKFIFIFSKEDDKWYATKFDTLQDFMCYMELHPITTDDELYTITMRMI